MVPDRTPTVGSIVDGDQVHAEGSPGQPRPVRQAGPRSQDTDDPAQRQSLPVIQRLLRKPEVPATSTPDLDHDERSWRAGIQRQQINLVAPQPEVSGEDGPAGRDQPIRDELLSRITDLLRHRRADPVHGPSMGGAP